MCTPAPRRITKRLQQFDSLHSTHNLIALEVVWWMAVSASELT
jgi:hypothetical protein